MTIATTRRDQRGRTLPQTRGVTGLLWITWRQHRFALLGVVTLLGGFALLMIIHGTAMHADYHRLGLDACGPLGGDTCSGPLHEFEHRYQSIADFLPVLLAFAPALIGAFVGAPLVARELETGTFRFAWTQGTDRARWLGTKLVLLGTALVVLALAFSALYGWWFHPWEPMLGRIQSGKSYEIEGVVFAARTVFAFALGALIGAIVRRTLVAMAATLAVWVGVVLSTSIYLRPHIMAPLVAQDSSITFVRNGWTIHDWMQDPAGHHLSSAQVDALTQQATSEAARAADPRQAYDQWFPQHGYTNWSSYQPNSRFWHFQIVEGVAYLVVTLLIGAAAVWWVRRRAT